MENAHRRTRYTHAPTKLWRREIILFLSVSCVTAPSKSEVQTLSLLPLFWAFLIRFVFLGLPGPHGERKVDRLLYIVKGSVGEGLKKRNVGKTASLYETMCTQDARAGDLRPNRGNKNFFLWPRRKRRASLPFCLRRGEEIGWEQKETIVWSPL